MTPRIERNVVYGMVSGLALLMDVHRPDRPNGCGLVLIPGSGWRANQGYDAAAIKDGGSAMFACIPSLLQAGYTLFVINHRAAPTFRYPAAVDDAQRAVRFVRSQAEAYGIGADRLGAVGYSSGGHLALLLGMLDGNGLIEDPDPVNRLSPRVTAVVAGAPFCDLTDLSGGKIQYTLDFMGMAPPDPDGIAPPDPVAAAAYRAASPVSHVSKASAPLLLMHGDADEIVPYRHSEVMFAAAQRADAEVKLIRVPGGRHAFMREAGAHPEWPDLLGEMVQWLDRHLKRDRLAPGTRANRPVR